MANNFRKCLQTPGSYHIIKLNLSLCMYDEEHNYRTVQDIQ